MKIYKTYRLWLFILFAVVVSCKKEDFPNAEAATINTTSVSAITGSTAISGGQIVSIGGNNVSTKGICWGTSINPTLSDNFVKDTLLTADFTCQMNGLIGGTTYYVRAFATNNGGISFGENMTFTTKVVPYLTTNAITSITGVSAISGGRITDSFGATIVSRGVCWSSSANPTITDAKTTDGAGDSPFTSAMTDLLPSTTYYVRSYATTGEGETAYGNEVIFETSITDYNGNIYTSVKIGTQIWMVENYRATHFANGTPIPSVTFHADDINKEYGAHYSWNDVVKSNFAPKGWHVPTDEEWRALYNSVSANGFSIKERGAAHWTTANGTNQTGFNALGSGFAFSGPLKGYAAWWTSSENSPINGLRWFLLDDGAIGRAENDKGMIFSVRLVKD